MSALILPNELPLHVGVNVIVRPGDPVPHLCEASRTNETCPLDFAAPPQDWVALTGPCDPYTAREPWPIVGEFPNPDCRDGRRIVPLYTGWSDIGARAACEYGRLVGRGSIEVVPVLGEDGHGSDAGPHICVRYCSQVTGSDRKRKAALIRDGHYHGFIDLDPLPVPGRDFGIVIDVTELA